MGIKHYVTSDNQQKVAPTERLILTVKTRLFKVMQYYQTNRWVDKLKSVQTALNSTVHQSHKLSPLEARLEKNHYKVFQRSIGIPSTKTLSRQKPPKFSVNDIVSITMDKGVLDKSYTGNNYSQILYEIAAKPLSREGVWIYKLRELLSNEILRGIFYESELKKVTGINRDKIPRNIQYNHARTNNNITEIFARLPGEKKSAWVPVEKLYYS